MKNFGKLICALTLLLATNGIVLGQSNAEKHIQNMYEQRAAQQKEKIAAEQKARQEQRKRAEQVKRAAIKAQQEAEAATIAGWEKGLEKVGASKTFDAKLVKKEFDILREVSTSADKFLEEGEIPSFQYFPVDMYIAHPIKIKVADRDILPNSAGTSMSDSRFQDYCRESFPGGRLDSWEKQQAAHKVAEKKRANPRTWKGISSMKIYHGPSLVVINSRGKCVLMDSDYLTHGYVECDAKNHSVYWPIAQERKQELTELGFSQKTVQRYGGDNPWNLHTYIACDSFDGHDLVEKVAVAWRYSSIATETTSYMVLKEKKSPRKQYRYIFIQKDGQEREVEAMEGEELPVCLDVNKRAREAFFTSQVQPVPPTYGEFYADVPVYGNSVGGCDIDIIRVDSKIFTFSRKSLLKVADRWFF